MSAEDADQRQQCKLFESNAKDEKQKSIFAKSTRFTVNIPGEIPKTTLRLIRAANSKLVVLSTHSDQVTVFTLGAQNGIFASWLRGLNDVSDPIVDASPDLTDESVTWLKERKDSSRFVTVSISDNGALSTFTKNDPFPTNIKLLMNDMVIGCNKAKKLEIRDRKGQPRKKESLPSYVSCDTEMIGEKNGECFGVVRKEDGDQARLHLIQKSDLTEYRQSIPIDNAFKPGVLSEDCTMHAQKTKNGIRVTDIKNGGITKEIQLDGMEAGQIMFFDDASKVIVSDEGDLCQFQVMNVHSGVKLDTAGIPTFERCTNLVKSEDGTVTFLNQKHDDSGAVLMNVLKCDDVCRMISTDEISLPRPDHRISLPSPNHNHIALMQRSYKNLSSHPSITIIDIQKGEFVDQHAMRHFPWNGVQWQSESNVYIRRFFASTLGIDSYSVKDRSITRESDTKQGDIAAILQRCAKIIQFPYDSRVLCTGKSAFNVDVGQNGDLKRDQSESNQIAIMPDPNINSNHHFSIDKKWLITYEKHPSDNAKGLIKWFHLDTLSLDHTCEYSKSQIQARKMRSCWMDSETNVYSDGTKIKVQRIGVGILGSMDIGYEPLSLQCANGFVITSSDKGVIHAWNLTFRAQSQSAHRLPVISNPSRFRSPITRANRSTQTESVLAYPERVRTLQMRAERGSVLATAEGYRSEPAKKPMAVMVGGIAAGVVFISVLIALLVWIGLRRFREKGRKRKERGDTVVAELHPMPEPDSEQSWMQQREGV